jgi:endonuclease/exonuclease/phosphatase family metal-dependent hydrolase
MLLLAIVLLQWWSLARVATQPADPSAGSDAPLGLALTWAAFGPWLFLQLLIFQNIARLTALTDWPQPLAFGWITLSNAVGLMAALWFIPRIQPRRWPGLAILGLILAATLWTIEPKGPVAAIFLLAGQMISSVLMAAVASSLAAGKGRAGLARLTVSHGAAMILLFLFLFLFYSGYDIALPIPNLVLPAAASLVVGAAAVFASQIAPAERMTTLILIRWRPAWLSLLLLLLPAAHLAVYKTHTGETGQGFPVRVMTYNLHDGFDPDGYLGMEALARTIEEQNADIVALQEVARGWVIYGSLDMLAWLTQRLKMEYVYGSTTGALWGNAILSRMPILDHELHRLPPDDLLLKRGFIWAQVDVGSGERLNMIATHYHHPEEGNAIRVAQSQAVLDYWQGAPRTAVLGDLNAQPGSPEMEMLRQAGFADALDLAGVSPGYTYSARAPDRRIDYIWLSPDLRATDAAIPPSDASDHLGIVAAIAPR